MVKANNPTEKARALQRTLYVAAKKDGTRRFHALRDRMTSPPVLQRAWQQVRQAKGAAGVDGATIAAIEAGGVDQFLADLKDKVEAGKYRPKPVRRVWIPKPGKREKRPLGIPVVADRVLQAAAKIVLEPIFEAGFLPCSYGFRPKRDAHQAMEVVRQGVNRGARWVVEVDFKDYFGSLDQEILMGLIQKRVSDRRMLRLCRLWMRAGVMEDGVTRSTVAGVPQGGVISPLFANIYAHAIDEAWEREMKQLGTIVRYADDLIILCHSELAARKALAWLEEQAAHLHLTLHPDKTRIVDLREGRDGFDFLGFHCRLVRSWKTGKWWLQHWPGNQAMAVIRGKVKAIAAPRYRLTWPMEDIVAQLNPVIRGWGNYFRWGNSSKKFSQIDSYVHERLALFDSKKRQKSGRRWGEVHTHAWYVHCGVHRLSGSVRYG